MGAPAAPAPSPSEPAFGHVRVGVGIWACGHHVLVVCPVTWEMGFRGPVGHAAGLIPCLVSGVWGLGFWAASGRLGGLLGVIGGHLPGVGGGVGWVGGGLFGGFPCQLFC